MDRARYLQMFELLDRTKTRYAECIRITRPDGTVFRFTAHDKPLRIKEPNGAMATYQSADSFSLTSLETSNGLVVSNMDIDGLISDGSITENDLQNGLFDNANVELFLAYWRNSQVTVLPLRTSWVGEIQIDGPKFKVDLRGIAQRLAQTFIQATSLECRWDFADSKCGLSAAAFESVHTVASVTSRDIFACSDIPVEKFGNYFQWGLGEWITGNNAGVKIEVLRQFEQKVQLFLPMNSDIQIGDTIRLRAGCDKSWETCCNDFSNQVRFGGEPFLQGSDVLSRYPSQSPEEPTTKDQLVTQQDGIVQTFVDFIVVDPGDL